MMQIEVGASALCRSPATYGWRCMAGAALPKALPVSDLTCDSCDAGGRSGFKPGNATVLIGLGLLRSYTGVGSAVASCGAGCACAPERFLLLHKPLVRARPLPMHSDLP